MRVYVAGISAHRQYNSSLDTFYDLKIQKGDMKMYRSGSRGDVERTYAFEQFMTEGAKCDAIFLADLDQKFPEDALERLRAHDKDMVSGHYMKRQTKALVSIWQWSLKTCEWPYIPYVNPPKAGTGLHPLATTGMGCVLIKREVVEAVASILPPGANPFEIGKLPEAAFAQSNFGSDYRFFYLAQKLGYKLWGDPDVDCPHAITMWLDREFEDKIWHARKEAVIGLMETPFRNSIRAHGMLSANALQGRLIQLLNARQDANTRDAKIALDAQIAECEMWIDELTRHSPPPEALEVWKQRYAWQNALPEYMMSNLRGNMKLPTFGSPEEVNFAVNNRDKTMEGYDEETATRIREQTKVQHNIGALTRMDGKNFISPAFSESPGEPTYLVGDEDAEEDDNAEENGDADSV